MKVAVIGGTGYVGLVTGIGLAVHRHRITCADIDSERVRELNKGILPIYEENLNEMLEEAQKNGNIRFTSCTRDAVVESQVIIIAVGTPENRSGEADLTHLLRALKEIAYHMNDYKVIVIKSTVPVGTCEMARIYVKENLRKTNCAFDVVSNPEFLREGSAAKDFMFPERIVIGADNERAAEILKELYGTFSAPVILTDTKSSELIKYACNSYLATRISFINEIAEICEKTDADINAVTAAMKLDKRIGGAYLAPGPGFGGPCLSKDLKSLINFSYRANANVGLLKSVLERNELQISNIFNKILHEFDSAINNKITILGLSFKAGTNDTRNSPAISLLELLTRTKNRITVYDPVVKNLDCSASCNVEFAQSLNSAVEASDCLIIMTEWEEFKSLDLEELYHKMRTPLIIDTRNLLNKKEAVETGFKYTGIGTGNLIHVNLEEELKCIV